jgi:membrane protein CcdC involved in cytochrome C biogenesis
MALRMRRMGKMRPLKLETLWIVPAMYAAVAALMFYTLPPVGSVATASLVGLAVGAAVGWQRGKMMQIHVDPETHALNQKASPAAMFFLIALILIRAGARSILGQESNISPAMLTDPLIAFALGMFTLQRVEMYLRARRLLDEARGRA